MVKQSFSTRAVHAGEHAPPADYTPVVNPIYATVGYSYDSTDDLDAVFGGTKAGYVYPRYGNPNLTALETAVASLEGGDAALAFSSGMAAIYAAFLAAGVQAGSHVVAALDVYGATFTMVNRLFKQLGASVSFVDAADLAQVESLLAETRPVALIVETVSNPLLKLADIPALTDLAHRYQVKMLVDNTFASPYLYRPLSHGVDYVIHSATKFISGHGDVMAGVVVTSAENRQKLNELNIIIGGSLGPFEAWLTLRGLKTLPLRMRQQCSNALGVAEWLAQQPKIARVNYPGLNNHPQHELARNLFSERGFGGLMSFEIDEADQATVFRFLEGLDLCLSATTLGDIYSLLMHPASSSHRSLTVSERAQIGIRDGLLRLSVGIEDLNDIVNDLEQALARI